MEKGTKVTFEKNSVIHEEWPIISAFLETVTEFKPQQVIINEKIRANFIDYTKAPREDRLWEAHKKEYDLHYIISGNELIDLSTSSTMEKDEYHEEEDFYLLHGTQTETIKLEKGDFMLLILEEAHRTGILEETDDVTSVQKIVFKIRKS